MATFNLTTLTTTFALYRKDFVPRICKSAPSLCDVSCVCVCTRQSCLDQSNMVASYPVPFGQRIEKFVRFVDISISMEYFRVDFQWFVCVCVCVCQPMWFYLTLAHCKNSADDVWFCICISTCHSFGHHVYQNQNWFDLDNNQCVCEWFGFDALTFAVLVSRR